MSLLSLLLNLMHLCWIKLLISLKKKNLTDPKLFYSNVYKMIVQNLNKCCHCGYILLYERVSQTLSALHHWKQSDVDSVIEAVYSVKYLSNRIKKFEWFIWRTSSLESFVVKQSWQAQTHKTGLCAACEDNLIKKHAVLSLLCGTQSFYHITFDSGRKWQVISMICPFKA